MVRIGSQEEFEVVGQGNLSCPKCKTRSSNCNVTQISLHFTLGFFIPMGTTKRLEIKCPSCLQVFPLSVTIEDFNAAKNKELGSFIGKAEGSLDIILFVALTFASMMPVFGILFSLLGGYLNRFSKSWLKKGYLVLFVLSLISTLSGIVLAIVYSKK